MPANDEELSQLFSMVPPGPLRVFAYGSLMWRPGFAYSACCDAVLQNYRRALCVWSWHHRGTPQVPGLVFGLDRIEGSYCQGCLYTVADENRMTVLQYLRERELITDVYQPMYLPLQTPQGELHGLTFVVRQDHRQYAGEPDADTCARICAGSVGNSGPNRDYVLSTADYLARAGVDDPWLFSVAEKLRG
ncbi:gamma-glutamylcyclotransferase [Granulosicoccaceae sp. 1_MG-2023]|nr:gamma-glutamylcyclotransferase [Granulosicoccaceae sp. 1_MG-2023]